MQENLMSDEIKNVPELQCEEFVGMWVDHSDMQDSNVYVRKLRATEWMK